MKEALICIAIMLSVMIYCIVKPPVGHHPPSDKSYWAGFRAGLRSEEDASQRSAYLNGYNDCMSLRKDEGME